MGTFVISKRLNGDYKFVFTTRKGKTIFTSIGFRHKEDCERMIDAMRADLAQFAFTKNKTAAGKYFFRLSKDGLVLATSRKFTTELGIKKGIDDIMKYLPKGETLDFSEGEFVFPPADEVFADADS